MTISIASAFAHIVGIELARAGIGKLVFWKRGVLHTANASGRVYPSSMRPSASFTLAIVVETHTGDRNWNFNQSVFWRSGVY